MQKMWTRIVLLSLSVFVLKTNLAREAIAPYPGLQGLQKIRVLISNPCGMGHMSSTFTFVRRLIEEGFCGEFELWHDSQSKKCLDNFYSESNIGIITDQSRAIYNCVPSFTRTAIPHPINENTSKNDLEELAEFAEKKDPVLLTITGGLDHIRESPDMHKSLNTKIFWKMAPYNWVGATITVDASVQDEFLNSFEGEISSPDSYRSFALGQRPTVFTLPSPLLELANANKGEINEGLWLPRLQNTIDVAKLARIFSFHNLAQLFEAREKFLLFPQYGLGRVTTKAPLIAAMIAALIELKLNKPIVFLNFNHEDVSKIKTFLNWRRQRKIVFFDSEEEIDPLQLSHRENKIIFINMKPVPHFLFEAIFIGADIPPSVQGANTMNILRQQKEIFMPAVLGGWDDFENVLNIRSLPSGEEIVKLRLAFIQSDYWWDPPVVRRKFPSKIVWHRLKKAIRNFLIAGLNPQSDLANTFSRLNAKLDDKMGDKVDHALKQLDPLLVNLYSKCEGQL